MEPVFGLCFTGRLSDELDALGAVVHQLGPVRVARPTTVVRARRALRRLVDVERFDAVVSHSPWLSGVFGPVLRRGQPPVVQWLHSPPVNSWVDRWGYRTKPRLVLCNSRYTASTAVSWFSGSRVEWMYPPVQLTTPATSEAARGLLRREFNTPDDSVVILQASRMQSLKGHQVHLAALARLREVPNWTLWIVGGAQRPFETRYVAALRARASELHIADRVRFVGERDDVSQVMAAADIFCQPNTEPEPFGIVFLEAMVAGLPVVASDLGGPKEVVDDSCGALVPSGDIEALSETLRYLIRDHATRRRLGSYGPDRARALCDPARQLGRLSDLLGQVVSA
jgi:glycosyltransferase involved in cell wall biosynthesis